MKNYTAFVLAVLASFSHAGYAQSEWVLKKEKNGIFIYGLKTDSSAFNSIKVETELPGRVEDLVSIVMDVKSHYKWAYGTKSVTLLKQISEREIIFYKEIESPSPVSDRDIVIHLKVTSGTDLKSTKIESTAISGFVPLKENFVRVPRSNETWIITPAEKKIRIKYYLQIDPGGSLPPLLVNMFATKGPYESFENLRNLLQKQGNN